MHYSIRLAAILTVLILSTSVSADEPAPTAKPLGFLEIGHDYGIRFPDSYSVFKLSKTGITKLTSSDGSSRPANWTMNLTVQVFTVLKHAQGSWVLLKHPASLEDATKWNFHRLAVAQLTKGHIKKLESTAEGRTELDRLRRLAAQKIKTSTTWVNLDHAVTISAVPNELTPVNLHVNTALDAK